MAEKTEKATPKKLRDARKKGQVAKSQDFPSAFTFVVSVMGTVFAASYFLENLGTYLIKTFKAVSSNLNMETRGGDFLMDAIWMIMSTTMPLLILVSAVGIIVNFLVIGPVFSMEAMKFDFKKLNPVNGIKQKFKLKVLVELLKSIFKIAGAATIIFLAIWNMIPQVILSVSLPVMGSAMILGEFLKKITIQVGIFFLLIALFDLFFQRRTFAKEMMMEKFELKQEYKDTEGDPHIKGRRREIAREIAYSEGPSASRKARVIVSNPTHIAVAIGFRQENDVVPMILTMGVGTIAEKILQIAVEEKIPIMRNVELAHELYERGDIGNYIPKETYKAIAEVLKWVESLQEQEETTLEKFK
jgi:type III secretion protein U